MHNIFFGWLRLKFSPAEKQSPKKQDVQFKKLPKKLSELDDSYRALIRELSKR